MMTIDRPMTKGEREDLIRLVKQREKVAKTAAEQRSAAMLAEFEAKVTALHTFATNEIWTAVMQAAADAAKEASEKIAAESERLGIPEEFHPQISFSWLRRSENVYEVRRTDMRRLAKTEIDALEKIARVQIETASVQAQTEIIAHGLISQAARDFLERLPPIENMMPALDVSAIQAKLAERARERIGYGGPHLVGD